MLKRSRIVRIKNNNWHMHSQVQIIKNNKFNINIFINIFINIDKKADIIILKEKIKQDLPIFITWI